MTYYLTFSRPGAAQPYAAVYRRTAGTYGPGEIAPLGGHLEVLPGELSGGGTLILSGLPRSRDGALRLEVGDRVRAYFDNRPDSFYLGEVTTEPAGSGKETLQLQTLKVRVGRAMWDSATGADGETLQLLKAPGHEFLGTVLSRALLPPDTHPGPIPEIGVTLQALTRFELLGDAFQSAMPTWNGATWGVNAQGEVTVVRPDQSLKHRFPKGRHDTPPGTLDYYNCVQFTYRSPAGTDASYRLRLISEVNKHGEAWLVESLTANVKPTLENPWKDEVIEVGWGQTFYSSIPPSPYRDEPWTYHQPDLIRGEMRLKRVFEAAQYVSHPAMNPDWTGKLADGLATFDDMVLSADALPILAPGDERVQMDAVALPNAPASMITEIRANLILQSPLPAGVRLVVRNRDTGAQHSRAYAVGDYLLVEPSSTSLRPNAAPATDYPAQNLIPAESSMYTGFAALDGTEHPKALFLGQYEYEFYYDPGDLAAYHASKGRYPNGFLLRVIFPEDQYFSKVRNFRLTAAARSDPSQRGWATGVQASWAYVGGPYMVGIVPPLSPSPNDPPNKLIASSFAQVKFAQPRRWIGGDAVTTDSNVTDVALVTETGGHVPLTRLGTENGRTTWGLLRGGEVMSRVLRLGGDPRSIGYFTVSVVDEASLLGYAAGLLRWKQEPVRSWKGVYDDLKWVPCSGMARFEHWTGDIDLDVVRVVYDLSADQVFVEAGTPQAIDDQEALAGVVDGIERVQRVQTRLDAAGGSA